eukprot:4035667-Pyramimonas_sp.AAC.1
MRLLLRPRKPRQRWNGNSRSAGSSRTARTACSRTRPSLAGVPGHPARLEGHPDHGGERLPEREADGGDSDDRHWEADREGWQAHEDVGEALRREGQ